jgi:5-methylcytosine-specific restriction endonuclease McrA
VVAVGEIVDHIIPIEEGGEFMDTENLQTLCMSCHNKKHMKVKPLQ